MAVECGEKMVAEYKEKMAVEETFLSFSLLTTSPFAQQGTTQNTSIS